MVPASIYFATKIGCKQDVKHSDVVEHLATNAGEIQVREQGTLPDCGTVPYHPSAVTNVMSLAQLTDECPVTMDSRVDNAFLVHAPRKIVRFARNAANLYSHAPTALRRERGVTPMPITPAIIQAMNASLPSRTNKACASRPNKRQTIYESTWTAGVDYDEDEEDEDYDPDDDVESIDDYNEDDYEEEDTSHGTSQDSREAQEILHEDEFAGVDEKSTGMETQSTGVDSEEESDNEESAQDETPPPLRSRRTRQPPQLLEPSMKGQSYEQQHLIIQEDEVTPHTEEMAQCAVNLLTTLKDRADPIVTSRKRQSHVFTHSLQRGIKKLQTRGYNAALKEMEQLHERIAGNQSS